MPVASKVGQYIQNNAIDYSAVHHARARDLSHAILLARGIPESTLRVHVLSDSKGFAALILPFQTRPDIAAVNAHSGRAFERIDDEQAGNIFHDCDSGHLPVMAHAYGLTVFIDKSITKWPQAFGSSGCSNALLQMSAKSLKAAFSGATVGEFSTPLIAESAAINICTDYSLEDAANRLSKLYRLPPMPDNAVKIMHLIADPDSEVSELASIVEQDPSLAAQIMRYARSALFNYRGEITDVRTAITAVLGFDRVSKLAMGIAAARSFKIPASGSLGLNAFWKHSLYGAVLSQALAMIAKPELGINERESYLAGLLHNFGLLLVGQLFPPEYRMLNKLRDAEPERPMRELERQVFGMGGAQEFISLGHGSLGAILLKLWGLPESCIKVAAMHQTENYTGDYENEVAIIQLANYLLALHDVGDEPPVMDPNPLFKKLGIKPDQAFELAAITVEQCQSLNDMAKDLAA